MITRRNFCLGISFSFLMALRWRAARSDSGTFDFFYDDLDFFRKAWAHELAHVSKIKLQGLERYRSIYRNPERSTHLAFAVREGAADMVSSLATGHTQPRFDYMRENERILWKKFEPFLYEQVSPATGWFGGPRDPNSIRPHALGYAIGHAICAAYYEFHGCGKAALNEILSAVSSEQFDHIAAPYRAQYSK